MRPIGCPETSVRNYHYTLRNSPEDSSSQLLRGGSLKSHIVLLLIKIELNPYLLMHIYCTYCLQTVYVSAHFEPSSRRQIHGNICEVWNYVIQGGPKVGIHHHTVLILYTYFWSTLHMRFFVRSMALLNTDSFSSH
jgi:hypothetical protein